MIDTTEGQLGGGDGGPWSCGETGAEMMSDCFKDQEVQPARQVSTDNNKLNLTADLLSNKLDLLLITG